MRIILLIMLTISFSACAGTGWYLNGKEIEDNSWQKHDGLFKAQLFLSDNPEVIYKQWNEGPANKVRIVGLPKVKNGKHFEAIIVFSGCEKDKKGQCMITGDWIVKTKAGSLLGEMKDSPIYAGPGPLVENQLMISTKGIGLAADAAHRGYLIQVRVKDRNGGKNVALQRTLAVEQGS